MPASSGDAHLDWDLLAEQLDQLEREAARARSALHAGKLAMDRSVFNGAELQQTVSQLVVEYTSMVSGVSSRLRKLRAVLRDVHM